MKRSTPLHAFTSPDQCWRADTALNALPATPATWQCPDTRPTEQTTGTCHRQCSLMPSLHQPSACYITRSSSRRIAAPGWRDKPSRDVSPAFPGGHHPSRPGLPRKRRETPRHLPRHRRRQNRHLQPPDRPDHASDPRGHANAYCSPQSGARSPSRRALSSPVPDEEGGGGDGG